MDQLPWIVRSRGVDLYTFGWSLAPPDPDFGPPMMFSAPQSLYLLVGAPDAESGFWLLRSDKDKGRSFRAIEPYGRMISPEKDQGHSVVPN